MVVKLGLKLARSTLFWLVLCLVVVELSAKNFLPLTKVDHDRQKPNQLTQEALTYKASQLKQLRNAPDVVILGSSLPMAAIRYCDNQWLKQVETDNDAERHHVNSFQGYSRGVYLQKQLSVQAGHPVSVFNFTGAASMPSDVSLILSKVIELRRQPKLVVVGFGPRDFMDNLVPEIGRTPAFNALAGWSSLSGNLPNSLSMDTVRELILTASSDLYRKRADWSLLVSEISSNLVRQAKADLKKLDPAKLDSTKQAALAIPSAAAVKEHQLPTAISALTAGQMIKPRYEAWHIDDYRKRYNPPNYLRYEQELERMAHLLDTCRQKDIAVVVVSMPITETNRQLIPLNLFKRYGLDLAAYARAYGADYVDVSISPLFTDEDFLDTVHLNPQGGKKFLDELASHLSQSVRVAKVLDANSVKSVGLTEKREKAL